MNTAMIYIWNHIPSILPYLIQDMSAFEEALPWHSRRQETMNATQGSPGISCFLPVSAGAPANLPTFFNFPGKPLKLISSNHTWLTYGCRTQFGTHLVQGHQAIEAGQNLTYPDDQLKQSLQNLLGISHLPCFQPDYILDELCPKLLSTFVVKLQIRFPQSNILFAIGMAGPIDVKQ